MKLIPAVSSLLLTDGRVRQLHQRSLLSGQLLSFYCSLQTKEAVLKKRSPVRRSLDPAQPFSYFISFPLGWDPRTVGRLSFLFILAPMVGPLVWGAR